MDLDGLLAAVFSAQSFQDVDRLVYDNADLIDDRFYLAARSLPSHRRNAAYESTLRAYGLLEDPEVCGDRERRAVDLIVRDLVPMPDLGDGARILTLASRDEIRFESDAIRLAMVLYAVTRTPCGNPSFLLARAEALRAEILLAVPTRAFDALQYVRRASEMFETLLEQSGQQDRAAIESAYVKLVNRSFGLRNLLRNEAQTAGFEP